MYTVHTHARSMVWSAHTQWGWALQFGGMLSHLYYVYILFWLALGGATKYVYIYIYICIDKCTYCTQRKWRRIRCAKERDRFASQSPCLAGFCTVCLFVTGCRLPFFSVFVSVCVYSMFLLFVSMMAGWVDDWMDRWGFQIEWLAKTDHDVCRSSSCMSLRYSIECVTWGTKLHMTSGLILTNGVWRHTHTKAV